MSAGPLGPPSRALEKPIIHVRVGVETSLTNIGRLSSESSEVLMLGPLGHTQSPEP